MLIKTYRLRLYFLYLIPLIALGGLGTRLYFLQIRNHGYWKELADDQHYSRVELIPMRGKIYDSNGHELAGSVILDAGYIELGRLGKNFNAPEKLFPDMARDLSNDLNLNFDKVYAQLSGKYNKSPLLARGLSETEKMKIRSILFKYREGGIPPNFISFRPENKRQYSSGDIAPHIIGFTQRDVVGETGDNKGVTGVERTYDEELRGHKEKYVTRTSATGNPMEPADPNLIESIYGHSVKLTINENLQKVTQIVLGQGVENSRADSGVAVVYHVKTGEILALANYPSFDVTKLDDTVVTQTKNRAVSDAIEPGSVMKIVTFTSLFNDNLVQPSELVNCSGGTWVVPGINRVIKDSHSSGLVPVSEVFQYSSNIGTIKSAQKFDKKTFYEHIKRFGFGEYTGVDLPSESRGRLRDYTKWDSWSMSSLPMGYEMQVTAVQVVSAVGAIANKGVRLRPHVVKEIIDHSGNIIKKVEPEVLGTVASPSACRKVINLMELVVEKGTAKPAKLEGYRVGGKTGTTKKLGKNGDYENSYIAGFCGIAPIEDPEVCIYVYVDNPRGSSVYGGSVAGPIFREICREAMRVLHIPENKPVMPPDEVKIALENVRKKMSSGTSSEVAAGLKPSDDDVTTGSVPKLINLTMAEAIKRAAAAGLDVRISGSGIVVAQDPPAYETIEDKTVVSLTLASTRQSIHHLVEKSKIYEKEEEEALAQEFDSEVSTGALSLKLTSNGDSLELSVKDQPDTRISSPKVALPVPSVSSEDKYPDLDKFVQQPVDPATARKNWENFQKRVKEIEKNQDAVKEPGGIPEEVVVKSQSSEVPRDRPIPTIDGGDEIDPTNEVAQPIMVNQPTKEELRSKPKRAVESLYDIDQ